MVQLDNHNMYSQVIHRNPCFKSVNYTVYSAKVLAEMQQNAKELPPILTGVCSEDIMQKKQ